VLNRDEVKDYNINVNFPEYSIKKIFPLVKESSKVRKYLPIAEMTQGRYPDKKWFWSLLFTVIPKWAKNYQTPFQSEEIKQRNITHLIMRKSSQYQTIG